MTTGLQATTTANHGFETEICRRQLKPRTSTTSIYSDCDSVTWPSKHRYVNKQKILEKIPLMVFWPRRTKSTSIYAIQTPPSSNPIETSIQHVRNTIQPMLWEERTKYLVRQRSMPLFQIIDEYDEIKRFS
ncbi:unnamed protein product [Didymodactylos carnosus]|nr:unnamed protein product [Didymodactylos carnosus]CAF4574584.1 unnamed protein product [Didymodactylos carnosus]